MTCSKALPSLMQMLEDLQSAAAGGKTNNALPCRSVLQCCTSSLQRVPLVLVPSCAVSITLANSCPLGSSAQRNRKRKVTVQRWMETLGAEPYLNFSS